MRQTQGEFRSVGSITQTVLNQIQRQRRYQTYRHVNGSIPTREYHLPTYRVLCPWCLGSDPRCRICGGTGLVCPVCTGARMQRHEGPDGEYRRATPCLTCTDWLRRPEASRYDEHGRPQYEIDREAEERAIQAWLDRHPDAARAVLAVLAGEEDGR